MIVVADTSPLNYLAVLGELSLLPTLFGDVLIPPAASTAKDGMQGATHAQKNATMVLTGPHGDGMERSTSLLQDLGRPSRLRASQSHGSEHRPA